ncbi:MAG TPA: hypothetical protein VFH51_17545 [Myxococcota bacterium]|nr:hypothetical protein [Myxococcota bacterium]
MTRHDYYLSAAQWAELHTFDPTAWADVATYVAAFCSRHSLPEASPVRRAVLDVLQARRASQPQQPLGAPVPSRATAEEETHQAHIDRLHTSLGSLIDRTARERHGQILLTNQKCGDVAELAEACSAQTSSVAPAAGKNLRERRGTFLCIDDDAGMYVWALPGDVAYEAAYAERASVGVRLLKQTRALVHTLEAGPSRSDLEAAWLLLMPALQKAYLTSAVPDFQRAVEATVALLLHNVPEAERAELRPRLQTAVSRFAPPEVRAAAAAEARKAHTDPTTAAADA